MEKTIHILYVLFPSGKHLEMNRLSIIRHLNEITYKQTNLFFHLISNNKLKMDKVNFKYISYSLNTYFIRNPIFFIKYFFLSIILGVKIIKTNIQIQIIGNTSGHLYQGLIAYIISRITGRKFLMRVNEDNILATILLLQKRKINHRIINLGIFYILNSIQIYLYKNADWIITHGPMDYDYIKKINNKCTFLPLSVDTNLFKKLNNKSKLSLKKDKKKIVLFVGRLVPIKGLDTLIMSFKNILKTFPETLLIIIGTGYDEKYYQKIVFDNRLEKNILFKGYVPQNILSEYYNMADVYVLPSLREELSNTIMEAMACGVPVITTNVGGNPFLIKNGFSGLLVPPKNIEKLTEALTRILSDSILAQTLSDNALKRIVDLLNFDIGKKYNEVLHNLIK